MALAVVALAPLGWGDSPAPPTPSAAITIEDLLNIRQVGAPVWSPDGRAIAFTWGSARS